MEYLILGLLILSPMTGYEVQQFIRQNLALICSHSAGSVQTALRKLEHEGYVTTAEKCEGRRRKKIFSITPTGREIFSHWVARPMQADKVKNMELARLFFLGLAQPEERIAAIRDYIRQMEEMETMLTAIQARFKQIRHSPLPPEQDWDAIFRFQGYTIDYGIAAARFEREWYGRLLCEWEEHT